MSFISLWHLRLERSFIFEIESLVRMIVSNEGSPFIFHMRLIQLLSFPLKHTLVTYGCHKSPKLTISIYRPRCATTGDSQASCSSAEWAEGLGAAVGGTPQFVSVLQLRAAGSLCTELPNATQVGPAVRSTESEAASGSLQARTGALHHPRGYSWESSSDGGYVLSKWTTRYSVIWFRGVSYFY